MSATIKDMELINADSLTPDQLMLGDLIKVDENIVEVIFIESDSTGDNYDIQTENEFGEREIVQYSYTDLIPLYVFIEDEEQLKVFLCASPHKNARGALVRLITLSGFDILSQFVLRLIYEENTRGITQAYGTTPQQRCFCRAL